MKRLKWISFICLSVMIGLVSFTQFNDTVSAAEENPVMEKINKDLSNLGFELSYNKTVNNEIHEFYRFDDRNDPHLLPRIDSVEPLAELNNDMTFGNEETLAAHQAFLENNTGQNQKLSTASFEYTQTDSVSTKTSHSVGASMTTAAEMKFPIASGSMSMTVKYDFNTTKDVTSSTTKKWAIPSQSIDTLAGHKYRVDWLLSVGTASGTTKLQTLVKAVVPYEKLRNNGNYAGKSVLWLGDAINTQKRLTTTLGNSAFRWDSQDSWTVKDSETAVRQFADAKYTAKIGTKLIMKVTDVTDSGNTVVKSMPVDETPKLVK